MNKFLEALLTQISAHWQTVVGGILFFLGRDILSAAHGNYWIVQLGQFAQDISISVVGYKAVAGVYTPAQIPPPESK